jgi:hypothetical protein
MNISIVVNYTSIPPISFEIRIFGGNQEISNRLNSKVKTILDARNGIEVVPENLTSIFDDEPEVTTWVVFVRLQDKILSINNNKVLTSTSMKT